MAHGSVGERFATDLPASFHAKGDYAQRLRTLTGDLELIVVGGWHLKGPTQQPAAQLSHTLTAQEDTTALARRIQASRLAKYEEFNRVGLETLKQLHIRMEREAKQREAEFQAMFEQLTRGRHAQDGIVGEMTELLASTQTAKDKKRQALYEEWNTKVFEKIQSRIAAELDARSTEDIENRLYEQYAQYLNTVNAKDGVFRDTIIESDYNPLESRRWAIRVPTGDIQDPLKRDLEKTMREKQLIGKRVRGPVPGKETLKVTMWDKLDATPSGHHMDKDGDYILKSMTKEELALRASHIHMDHYTYPRGNAYALAECPPGKLMVPPIGGRTDLFETLQMRGDPYAEHRADRDAWLVASWSEGKRMVDGPEVLRGRKDLSETLHQLSNPYQDQRTLGDQWLEAKGKRRVDGPEQHRGRKDLFGTIQQDATPVIKSHAVGDQYLEDMWFRGKRTDGVSDGCKGRRDLYAILHQRGVNPYRQGAAASEKVGDAWLEGRGKKLIPGAEHDNDMRHTLRGDNLALPPPHPKMNLNVSHLECKRTMHPMGTDPVRPLKTIFTASCLEAHGTVQPNK
ncbi:hypothetical protein WJX72_004311 [[Myrmecia] bisecta]|uniref:Uncharacterized protein n=1 Tax=[Myrmecia] bisecta TaxID=41462 RepID=A0AAW1R697_9CHLO